MTDPDEGHDSQPRHEAGTRTRWGRVLMPLTVIAFLAVFIVVMLVIYNLAVN